MIITTSDGDLLFKPCSTLFVSVEQENVVDILEHKMTTEATFSIHTYLYSAGFGLVRLNILTIQLTAPLNKAD